MTKIRRPACNMLLVLIALALCLMFHAVPAHAEGYTRPATLRDGSAYPGVYYVSGIFHTPSQILVTSERPSPRPSLWARRSPTR